jgi:hypothetical protein
MILSGYVLVAFLLSFNFDPLALKVGRIGHASQAT